jgi:hypothetical protein
LFVQPGGVPDRGRLPRRRGRRRRQRFGRRRRRGAARRRLPPIGRLRFRGRGGRRGRAGARWLRRYNRSARAGTRRWCFPPIGRIAVLGRSRRRGRNRRRQGVIDRPVPLAYRRRGLLPGRRSHRGRRQRLGRLGFEERDHVADVTRCRAGRLSWRYRARRWLAGLTWSRWGRWRLLHLEHDPTLRLLAARQLPAHRVIKLIAGLTTGTYDSDHGSALRFFFPRASTDGRGMLLHVASSCSRLPSYSNRAAPLLA